MIKLSQEFGARVHIVHHSSADSLALLREARAARMKITAETCPHYLSFPPKNIPDGARSPSVVRRSEVKSRTTLTPLARE